MMGLLNKMMCIFLLWLGTAVVVINTSELESEICCAQQDLLGTGLECCIGDKRANVFFIGTHICCGGVVHRREGPGWKCCGKKTYNNETHGCCCGETGPCEDGANPGFTGQPKVYNRFTHSCCFSEPQKNQYGLDTGCCEDLPGVQHDISTHMCCGKRVMRRRGPHSVCCGGQVHIGGVCCEDTYFQWADPKCHKCCKSNVYDTRHQICCGENVKRLTHGIFTGCCEGVLYHSSLQICCYGDLRNSTYGQASRCCGDGEYNADSEDCCREQVINTFRRGCCGGHIYDRKRYVCCNDVLFYKPEQFCKPECCGQVVYDAMTHICCTGKPELRRFGEATRCCNSQIYNSGRFRCCNRRIISRKFECCGNSKFDPLLQGCCVRRSYKTATQICCHGKVMRNKFGRFGGCCLSDSRKPLIYDVRESICCENKLIKLKIKPYLPGREVCCDGKVIDAMTQHCCNNSIIVDRFFDRYTECCDKKPFDKFAFVCCNNTLKQRERTLCCEGNAIDLLHPSQYVHGTCCLDKGQMEGYTCCSGMSMYTGRNLNDPEHTPEIICGDGVTFNYVNEVLCEGVSWRISGRESDLHFYRCCGHRMYDSRTHACTYRTILLRPEDNKTNLTVVVQPDPDVNKSPVIPCHTFGNATGLCCGKVRDVNVSICCAGNVIDTKGKSGLQCCGHLAYNTEREICCTFPDRGFEVFRRQGTSTECCKTNYGMMVYDDVTQRCCENGFGVVEKVAGVLAHCCGGVIFPAKQRIDYYCDPVTGGAKVIDPTKEKICGSNVIRHSIGDEARCCGDHQVYNPDTQICCSELQIIEKRPNLRCCGEFAVEDTDKDMCCRDRLHAGVKPAPPGVQWQCCGPLLYDAARQICECEFDDSEPCVPHVKDRNDA